MPEPVVFPNEILQRIFHFAILPLRGDDDDYIKLWVAARQVSHSWRANVAQAYLDTIVRDANRCHINFAGTSYSEDRGITMVFDRMQDDDKSRIVFKETEKSREIFRKRRRRWYGRLRNDEEQGTKEERRVEDRYRAWKKRVDDYRSNDPKHQHITKHVINLNGYALDSALPDLEACISKAEVSFEYEPMLAAFIGEQAEQKRRFEAAKTQIAADLSPLLNRKTHELGRDWINTLGKSAEPLKRVKKEVRRDRIRWFCKKTGYCSDTTRYGARFLSKEEMAWQHIFPFSKFEKEEGGILLGLERSHFQGKFWWKWADLNGLDFFEEWRSDPYLEEPEWSSEDSESEDWYEHDEVNDEIKARYGIR